MKHLGTKTIETKRLILRRFEMTDAQAMFDNWASDPLVTEFLTWTTHETVDVSKAILKEWIEKYKENNFYQWAITLKENGDAPIGSIAIVQQRDSIEMVHVGYCIGRNWWNKGITSEALKGLVKYFFEEVKVNRIESRHDPRNPNSGKVMLKCGLRLEGTLRQADISNKGTGDCSMYGMLAEDYFKNAKG